MGHGPFVSSRLDYGPISMRLWGSNERADIVSIPNAGLEDYVIGYLMNFLLFIYKH